jgi:hypothetical protein
MFKVLVGILSFVLIKFMFFKDDIENYTIRLPQF